ncbi:hypothetical protein H8K90_03105 [Winogradskyella echinorum]|uniref:Peptidase M56 domain-containing protein n=1 Tax=Winogradskyella echinorum TaxID=538189 RepID=A0ABR6XY01_9FLAO|nr:M56 family metallopeptidase [Winogradskyella echinorum]MBC3845357.1 hypothetical protein [Winogradskyella echinorum]MBC5749705.1 hypothetical protein [Winogradskyella echinorum]
METYLFKFSACLAVFWLVYVLFLERQNMHRFKRFYLLSAVVLALIIPALTITRYIEPVVTEFEMSQMYLPMESSFVEMPQEEPPFMDLETILWMLYGFGVLLFTIRFALNLFKMYKRISNNETITKRSFIYVLLEECRIPHSFFKYIFFNKSTYKTDSIPREVQLHEETHAKQLHSLDIIVIELLQIVFWFHPLIYILKHHIKLNHEFLADQAVLNQGSDTKTYQNILLQFSSSTQDYQLSSAINYSSIKKRFTVMKTNTSKTRIWLSSLLLLPIIAILFYVFAEKEYVEKENSDIVSAIKEELKEADNLNMLYINEATESNQFLVTVEKNGNTIQLRCENGCRWSHLILEPSSEPYIINDFGFSNGQTLETDKFTFSIQSNNNGVELSGIKGTAWIDLAFSLPENQKQAINYKGMTNTTSIQFEEIENNLEKRAEENYYTKQFFKVKNKNGQYVKKRFNELNYQDKIKWVYVDPIPYTRIDVTKSHFEEAKNSKKYIIKVDGNYISRDDLKEFKASDFITFSYTPISELAKMKEESVLNLVTKNAYDFFLNLMIEQYRKISEDYENKLSLLENRRKEKTMEIVSTYEFLSYNYKRFPLEIIQKHNLKSPTPISTDVIKKTHQSYLEIPILYIDKDKNLFLNNKPTSIETIQKDFNDITKFKKSEIILEADGRQIHKNFLDKIMNAIGENLANLNVDNGQVLIFDPDDFKPEESKQQKATKKQVAEYNAWAKKINVAIKKAKANKSYAYPIIKQKNAERYINIYKNLMTDEQRKNAEPFPQIPPPPPPPPPAPNKSKGGPNAQEIQPIEIFIDKNNQIKLNGRTTTVSDINNEVKKLNQHLAKDDHRKYVMASIILEKNTSLDIAKTIQKKLREVEIWNSSMSYNENMAKSNLSSKHFSLYSGLSLEEAKAKEKKIINEPIKIDTSKNSPWKIKTGDVSYQYIDDNDETTLGQIPPSPPTPPAPKKQQLKEKTVKGYPAKNNKEENKYPAPSKPDDLEPITVKGFPSKSESTLDFVIRMAKANAKFFNEGKSISSDEAIALIKKNNKLNINANEKGTDGKPLVYISKRPIHIGVKGKVGEPFSQKQKNILPIINGKKIKTGKLSMKLDDIKNLKLTLPSKEIISFKFKIPGIKTQHITGNTITDETIKNLSNVKTGDYITLFDIKYKGDSKISPLVIEIID